MKIKIYLTSLLIITLMNAFGQQKQRPVEELINSQDPGWPLVLDWINAATNPVEVLPVDSLQARQTLYELQITTRSPMGAVVWMSGGILIDKGWIRILGSGNVKLTRALSDWRKTIQLKASKAGAPLLVVADDAIGGIFVINDGSLGTNVGKIYYLAPDTLEFESLDLGYTDFLIFCFNRDLNKFYEGYRWKSWKEDVSKMSGDSVMNFYPFLWTKEGKKIEKSSRRAVPVTEYYELVMSFREQFWLDK